MKRIAISMGDLNGVGLQIALEAHTTIRQFCRPLYCINEKLLTWGATMLDRPIPEGFETVPVDGEFEIIPGLIDPLSGAYAYDSFLCALNLTRAKETSAFVTLPIHKKAWELAGIPFKGHTDALAKLLDEEAIMMLGCETLFVPLYTDHIPLHAVPKQIKTKKLLSFFLKLSPTLPQGTIGVLGLNPHAGDFGVLGHEDRKIAKAIRQANEILGVPRFDGPLVPDTAFTPKGRERFGYIVAMYHDQGLTPLKALYFEESINVSLGLSVIRTSVDHGTAFDIAYSNAPVSCASYINAVKAAVGLSS